MSDPNSPSPEVPTPSDTGESPTDEQRLELYAAEIEHWDTHGRGMLFAPRNAAVFAAALRRILARRASPRVEAPMTNVTGEDVKLLRKCSDWIDEVYGGRARDDSFSTKLDALADKLAGSDAGDSQRDAALRELREKVEGERMVVRRQFRDEEIGDKGYNEAIGNVLALIDEAMSSTPSPSPRPDCVCETLQPAVCPVHGEPLYRAPSSSGGTKP